METIFVTGGAGYIGSICTEELLNVGYHVAVFDNLSEGHRAAIDPRAQFFQGDLADRVVVQRALHASKASAVMHVAASYVTCPRAMQRPGSRELVSQPQGCRRRRKSFHTQTRPAPPPACCPGPAGWTGSLSWPARMPWCEAAAQSTAAGARGALLRGLPPATAAPAAARAGGDDACCAWSPVHYVHAGKDEPGGWLVTIAMWL